MLSALEVPVLLLIAIEIPMISCIRRLYEISRDDRGLRQVVQVLDIYVKFQIGYLIGVQ